MNSELEHAEILSIALQARSVLSLLGFITDAENDRIHNRLKKYQNKHKVDGSLIKSQYNRW